MFDGYFPEQVATNKTDTTLESQINEKLKTIDKIMAAVNSLEEKVKELEESSLESLPDTLDNAEKRLIRWFRQCNSDRQAMLLSTAEVFADMSLKEEKEKNMSFKDIDVA